MAEYYAQRSGFGMILTEATSVDAMGVGYPNTPGIWSQEQLAEWQRIVDGVHDKGATILSQLWHVGRISDPVYLEGKPNSTNPILQHSTAPGQKDTQIILKGRLEDWRIEIIY